MLRGIHKNMICIHPPQSRYFEVVWFILRSDYKKERDRDMIREAGMILNESEKNFGSPPCKGSAQRKRGVLLFFVGVGCGMALACLLWLCLTLSR
jgi:hypothetical protein